ncbi:hypothetical protein BG004_007987 [Podila humilis]|nr:hypothetical protein BG004_007987 [Podila humilis]
MQTNTDSDYNNNNSNNNNSNNNNSNNNNDDNNKTMAENSTTSAASSSSAVTAATTPPVWSPQQDDVLWFENTTDKSPEAFFQHFDILTREEGHPRYNHVLYHATNITNTNTASQSPITAEQRQFLVRRFESWRKIRAPVYWQRIKTKAIAEKCRVKTAGLLMEASLPVSAQCLAKNAQEHDPAFRFSNLSQGNSNFNNSSNSTSSGNSNSNKNNNNTAKNMNRKTTVDRSLEKPVSTARIATMNAAGYITEAAGDDTTVARGDDDDDDHDDNKNDPKSTKDNHLAGHPKSKAVSFAESSTDSIKSPVTPSSSGKFEEEDEEDSDDGQYNLNSDDDERMTTIFDEEDSDQEEEEDDDDDDDDDNNNNNNSDDYSDLY